MNENEFLHDEQKELSKMYRMPDCWAPSFETIPVYRVLLMIKFEKRFFYDEK